MRPWANLLASALLFANAAIFSGCANLRPVADRVRYFALSAVATDLKPLNQSSSTNAVAIGLGPVTVPDYLLHKPIVLRRNASELRYLETAHWAERLDKAIQRVLSADLAAQLGFSNVLVLAWRRSDVAAEVYLDVERFEFDEQGSILLEARWRITNPGAEINWHTGFDRVVKKGPLITIDPAGAVERMSQALAELSREIAGRLKVAESSSFHSVSSREKRQD